MPLEYDFDAIPLTSQKETYCLRECARFSLYLIYKLPKCWQFFLQHTKNCSIFAVCFLRKFNYRAKNSKIQIKHWHNKLISFPYHANSLNAFIRSQNGYVSRTIAHKCEMSSFRAGKYRMLVPQSTHECVINSL